jgi:signal transduction histidine kinase
MRERVKHLGGSIEIRTGVGQGTCVVISVPFTHREAGRDEGPS